MTDRNAGTGPVEGGFRALVVDDEVALRRAVSAYLERDGFSVRTAGDGAEALALAREEPPDVVVLDVVMPGLDGIEVCRQLRTFSDAYIIMLTARSEEIDTLVGLAAGADDYMTKPFSPRVLVARVRTLMRRPRSASAQGGVTETPARRFGVLVIDPAPREVHLDGEPVALTPTEFDLLDALSPTRIQPPAAHRPRVGRELGRRRASRRRPSRPRPTQAGGRLRQPSVHRDRPRRGLPDGFGMRGIDTSRLVWRLFLAMTLVVWSGAITMLIVATLVAPQVFHRHLGMVSAQLPDDLQAHVDYAFGQAVLFALGVGVFVALVATLAVIWLISRRVADPIADVADAAARVAGGDLSVRVPTPGLGRELSELTDSFNRMATRLAGTETVRRQLIADVAHELRNPLASLQATAEAAADGVLPEDPETWESMLTQIGRMQRLVDDMSAVSKAEEHRLDLHLDAVDLDDVVGQAVTAAQAQFDAAGIALDLRIAGHSPAVRVDADRMGEVLANLLGNAQRHSHPGDTVTVRVGTRPGWATIEVVDTGDGFPPEDADRLFERFYRGDTARNRDAAGSGIGLTLARSVVAAHGGTLRGASDGLGLGAAFTISLPLVGRSAPHLPTPTSGVSDLTSGSA